MNKGGMRGEIMGGVVAGRLGEILGAMAHGVVSGLNVVGWLFLWWLMGMMGWLIAKWKEAKGVLMVVWLGSGLMVVWLGSGLMVVWLGSGLMVVWL